MEKVWKAKVLPAKEKIQQLAGDLSIGERLAALLLQRNLSTPEEVRNFVQPSLSALHDPFLMKDMDKAVARLEKALQLGEKMVVYGDYDVDGTTSVALVYSFLSCIHPHLEYYIPDRYLEGYGLSRKGIDLAVEEGCSLMITLDCGVKSVELVAYAASLGLDIIICDHHQPGETLPLAVAVLDAKRADCPYPYKELSGCGVGFKLCQALSRKLNRAEEELWSYLDLVCISIACDIVEMKGENRVMAHFGLKEINRRSRLGVKVLLEKAFEKRPKQTYDISDIVFYAGPRINAAGRIAHAKGAVALLLEKDEEKARAFAAQLHGKNDERKTLEAEMTLEAEALLASDRTFRQRKSTVVYQPNWKKGVIGIVASRLLEKYYRPTVVLTYSEGKVAGSARSVEGFDIHAAIEACSGHLLQFGGHTHAAGLTLLQENVPAFSEAFEEYVRTHLSPENEVPVLEYDLEIPLEQVSFSFVKSLQRLAPFGPGNMNPLFVTRGVKDTGMYRLYGEHLSVNLPYSGGFLNAMAFFQGKHEKDIKAGKLFDICYHAEISEFNGTERLQLRILDMKAV